MYTSTLWRLEILQQIFTHVLSLNGLDKHVTASKEAREWQIIQNLGT